MAVLLGFGPAAPFALLTVSDRDSTMAANMEEILTEHDEIEKGILVVGDQHVEGIVAELESGPVEVGETHSSTPFKYTL
jgi:pheromone shutdown protein TraB